MTHAYDAVSFAPLINKVVRLERPMTHDEATGDPAEAAATGGTVGGEGIVVEVRDARDVDGRPGVEVMFDYGMAFGLFEGDVGWAVTVRSHAFDHEEKRRVAEARGREHEAQDTLPEDDGSDLL